MEMVVVATVGNRFEAELLAAKLGAMGVLWEIRSRQLVDTTHPIGAIEVLVPRDEEDTAREVLEPDPDWDGPSPRPAMAPGLRVLRAALALAFLLPLTVVLYLWLVDVLDVVG